LGLAYSWLSDYNNAIQSYELVLSLDDTTATAHFNIANSYYELKDYSKALSHYQQAFEIDDQDYNSLTSIGDCYSMTDNQQHALDYYHKALSINPNHPEAIMGIVSILKQTDRMDEAILFIEKAFALSPQSFELLFSIIEYYKEDEQTEKLKNLFNITLEQVENKADFFKFFTHYCCQNELYNFGIEILLEHLHDEIADDMILYYLAAMYYLSGNIPYGNDYLKNALLMNYEEYASFLALDSVLQSFSEINELIALYRP
jgi:tetratricopeptide (TPR) repeat protein